MSIVIVEYEGKLVLEMDKVAEAVGKLDSKKFGQFIEKVFDHLESNCKTEALLESQLCWIASQMPDSAKKKLIGINEFWDLENKEGVTFGKDEALPEG